jgi:hypothetical protein
MSPVFFGIMKAKHLILYIDPQYFKLIFQKLE